MVDLYVDVIGKIYKPHFSAPEQKDAVSDDILNNVLPAFLSRIDAKFTSSSRLVGDRLTIADFCIGGIYTNFAANPNVSYGGEKWGALLDKFPNFKAYGERFRGHMEAYLSSRPAAPV